MEHFWSAFYERFIVQNEQLLRKLYDDRVQRADETIAEYADSLRSIAIKLGLSVDGSDVREKFVKGLWEKQVKVRLETVVKLIPPSYRGLVEWATDFEARSGREKAAATKGQGSEAARVSRTQLRTRPVSYGSWQTIWQMSRRNLASRARCSPSWAGTACRLGNQNCVAIIAGKQAIYGRRVRIHPRANRRRRGSTWRRLWKEPSLRCPTTSVISTK